MVTPARLPVVGVMGSGSYADDTVANDLGALIARLGAHLLTGGGSGVMFAVSKGFVRVRARKGRCIGVLPSADDSEPTPSAPAGYPNPYVEIAVRTHLPFSGEMGTHPQSRNHINVLSSDAIVALPGGAGTASEVQLAIKYDRPVAAMGSDRTCIPNLPESVALFDSLQEIEDFLIRTLGRPRAT